MVLKLGILPIRGAQGSRKSFGNFHTAVQNETQWKKIIFIFWKKNPLQIIKRSHCQTRAPARFYHFKECRQNNTPLVLPSPSPSPTLPTLYCRYWRCLGDTTLTLEKTRGGDPPHPPPHTRTRRQSDCSEPGGVDGGVDGERGVVVVGGLMCDAASGWSAVNVLWGLIPRQQDDHQI